MTRGKTEKKLAANSEKYMQYTHTNTANNKQVPRPRGQMIGGQSKAGQGKATKSKGKQRKAKQDRDGLTPASGAS